MLATSGLVLAGSGIAFTVGGWDAAAPFLAGGVGGLFYCWLLQQGVDSIPAPGQYSPALREWVRAPAFPPCCHSLSLKAAFPSCCCFSSLEAAFLSCLKGVLSFKHVGQHATIGSRNKVVSVRELFPGAALESSCGLGIVAMGR
jgi:hypothetical protein